MCHWAKAEPEHAKVGVHQDQHTSFLTDDVYASIITLLPKTAYCIKCSLGKKKKFHTFLSLHIFTLWYTTWQILTLAPSVFFFFFSTLHHGSTVYWLLCAHFSYLLARAIIGLQLGQDPMSLLQHSADLVPHGCLCLCGLGIWEGKKKESKERRRERGRKKERVGSESVMYRKGLMYWGEVAEKSESKMEGEEKGEI